MITKAKVSDCDELTRVALTSKAHWGYTPEQIESCRDDLTVTPDMFEKYEINKSLSQGRIAAFHILNLEGKSDQCTLEFLFVSPEFIGKRRGRALLKYAFIIAKCHQKKSMRVLSDPNAESFYAKYGFNVIEQKESSIAGRFLPLMERDLSDIELNPVV
jgi:N-acetylglutamate synthase-like GNAT family acetyltransferase